MSVLLARDPGVCSWERAAPLAGTETSIWHQTFRDRPLLTAAGWGEEKITLTGPNPTDQIHERDRS
jgi:hypothetical protein